MLRFIERKMMVELGARRIRHIGPLNVADFRGLAKQVLVQLEDEFMAAAPLTLHAPAPRVFAAAWGLIRETLLAGPTSRAQRETVAATISYINECPYCVDAHTGMLHAARKDGTASAVRNGTFDTIGDPHLRALSRWAAVSRTPGARPLLDPPFGPEHGPRMRGTVVAFHYLNRVVHVFLGASPMQLPEAMKRMRSIAMRIGGRLMMRRFVERELTPGRPLIEVPGAELPEELEWAASDPSISRAMASWAAELETAAADALSEQARTLVNEQLDQWKGEDVGFGRRWLDDALGNLSGSLRAEVELCLLVALRSYAIDDDVVVRYQAHHPGSNKVVGATAWAAMRAALRVGSWLAPQRAAASTSPEVSSRPAVVEPEPELEFTLEAAPELEFALESEPASVPHPVPEPEPEPEPPVRAKSRSVAGSRRGAKALHLIAVPPKDEPKR